MNLGGIILLGLGGLIIFIIILARKQIKEQGLENKR